MGPTALNAVKTACDHGHTLKGANLYIDPQKSRKCRTCMRRIQNTRAAAFFSAERKPKPGKRTLAKKIKSRTFVELGIEYGVTDTAVRKWAKDFGLIWPRHRRIKKPRQ